MRVPVCEAWRVRREIVEYGEAGEHVLEPLNPGIRILFMSVAANDRCPAGKCVNGEAPNELPLV